MAGTIRQDRFDAIYGVVGEKNTPMIPVSVEIQGALSGKDVYRFELIQEAFLSPVLVNLAVGSALSNTERSLGANTLQIGGKIRLAGADAVDLQDVLSSDMGTVALAGSVAATPLYYLMSSGFPDLRIEGIDLSVTSRNDRSTATLEQAWSTKSEVRPGDHLEVIALLRLPGGAAVTQRIPISIPDSVTDRNLMLAVGGGANINALQYRLAPPGSAARERPSTGQGPEPYAAEQPALCLAHGSPALVRYGRGRVSLASAFPDPDLHGGPRSHLQLGPQRHFGGR